MVNGNLRVEMTIRKSWRLANISTSRTRLDFAPWCREMTKHLKLFVCFLRIYFCQDIFILADSYITRPYKIDEILFHVDFNLGNWSSRDGGRTAFSAKSIKRPFLGRLVSTSVISITLAPCTFGCSTSRCALPSPLLLAVWVNALHWILLPCFER